MSVIKSENFDGSSSLPTDWNEGAAVFSVVNAELGVSPSSPPNMLSGLATSSGGPIWANWDTGDGNGGDVTVGSWLGYHVTSGNPGNTGVFCRGTAATMTSSGSAYVGRVNWNTGVPEVGLFAAGSWTSLAIGDGLVVVPDGSVGYLTAVGSSISLAIRRPSDGSYLTASDGWQSGPTYALTATDSTLTADGYAGVYAEPNGSSFNAFFDDFSLETPGLPTPGVSGTLAATEARDADAMAGSSARVGTAAKAEARDHAALAGSEPAATLSRAESHDAAALAGSEPAGSLARAEARDAAAAPARSTAAGTAAAAERRDAAAFATVSSTTSIAAAEAGDAAVGIGRVPDCIFAAQEAGDYAATASVAAAGGAAGPPESGDVAALHGDFPAGSMAASGRGDVAAFAGTESFRTGALSGAEAGDTGVLVGAAPVVPYLVGRESGDTAGLSGAVAARGRAAATERRDTGALAAGTATAGRIVGVEAGDRATARPEALGVPPSFRVRERPDIGAIGTGVAGLRYNVYMSPVADAPIDYSTPVATTAGLTWSTARTTTVGPDGGAFPSAAFPPAAFPDVAFAGSNKATVVILPGGITLAVPGTWSFGQRAENEYGEELNLDCAISITFDAAGRDVSDIPGPPVGLRAIATAGAGLTALWQYPAASAAPRQPTGFRVYLGAGGAPDYSSPAAVYLGGDPDPIAAVPYNAAIVGTWTVKIPSLVDGTTYTVGVRAFNATGEETNTVTASATADGTGPLPVGGLTATAVV